MDVENYGCDQHLPGMDRDYAGDLRRSNPSSASARPTTVDSSKQNGHGHRIIRHPSNLSYDTVEVKQELLDELQTDSNSAPPSTSNGLIIPFVAPLLDVSTTRYVLVDEGRSPRQFKGDLPRMLQAMHEFSSKYRSVAFFQCVSDKYASLTYGYSDMDTSPAYLATIERLLHQVHKSILSDGDAGLEGIDICFIAAIEKNWDSVHNFYSRAQSKAANNTSITSLSDTYKQQGSSEVRLTVKPPSSRVSSKGDDTCNTDISSTCSETALPNTTSYTSSTTVSEDHSRQKEEEFDGDESAKDPGLKTAASDLSESVDDELMYTDLQRLTQKLEERRQSLKEQEEAYKSEVERLRQVTTKIRLAKKKLKRLRKKEKERKRLRREMEEVEKHKHDEESGSACRKARKKMEKYKNDVYWRWQLLQSEAHRYDLLVDQKLQELRREYNSVSFFPTDDFLQS